MSFDRKLFFNYWHLACHRRELSNYGDYIKFDTPNGEVVIFNDMGTLVAFDNRCPHRGAKIFLSDSGNQPATCNYHGWTFQSGKLFVPNKQNFTNCNISSAKLNQYLIEWCGDFVFFGVSPLSDLYSQLGSMAEILENISFNIDKRHDFNRYKYECYWPLAIENALEPYHIDMVHPNTLANLELSEGENIFDGLNSVWYAPIENKRVHKGLSKMNRYFNIDFQFDGYMSIYLFPFTMVSSTLGYSYSVQNFFPVGDGSDLTNFTSRLLTAPTISDAASGVLESFFDSTALVNRKVFEEDHSICKIMPRDSWNKLPLKFASDSEEKIQHFRAMCRNAS